MDTQSTPSSPVPPSSGPVTGEPATVTGEPGPAGLGRIRRFAVMERVSHWLYALFFLVALTSGLLMWIPATREWMAGDRYTVSQYHGYVGAAMVVLPILLFLLIDRHRLARDIREVDKWNGDDRRWFWLAMRGYTLRGRQMPPQGRFNAGQKVNVVLIAAMAVGFAATGGILMHKQDMPPWLVSRALWLHGFLAVAAGAIFLGHLAHVFITKHGRTYLSGMIRGWVPEGLAWERHRRWWQEETRAAGTREAETRPAEGASRDEPGSSAGV
jgi:formate dehydrogenase subunit gamma